MSVFTAVKTFIFAHKVAIGVTTGVAVVSGVGYAKREAIANRLCSGARKKASTAEGKLAAAEAKIQMLEQVEARLHIEAAEKEEILESLSATVEERVSAEQARIAELEAALSKLAAEKAALDLAAREQLLADLDRVEAAGGTSNAAKPKPRAKSSASKQTVDAAPKKSAKATAEA